MLNVGRLRVFREVAHRGSISAAAAALDYTQSAVSQQIAALEREAGVKLVVSTDAHEVAALDYTRYGIGQARRAWCTADDVANTRTWKQLDRLRKKRS